MSDAVVAPAPAAASPKQKKKPSAPKKPATHPKYSEMAKAAIQALKERGGSSRQAILKYIVKNYNVGTDEKVVNQHLKMALKHGVTNNSLKQSKGTGAAGSFKLGEKPAVKKSPKKKAVVKKSPAKPKVKKTVAKPKKATSPKKAVAAKKPKSPGKKSPAAKKPAVKAAKPKVVKKKASPKKAAGAKKAAKK